MLWTMTKNNWRMMIRSKMLLILIMFSPIMVIAALSSAFNELLQNEYENGPISIGYEVIEEGPLASFFRESKEMFAENNMDLVQYQEEVGKKLVQDGQLDAFMKEFKNDIIIYTQDQEGIPALLIQYVLEQYYTSYENTYRKYTLETMGADTEAFVEFDTVKLEGMKLASAENYYSIAQMVYFLWCSMLFLTAVVQSERKNHISRRFKAAPVNSFLIYLSKFLPCICMGACSATVTCTLSTLFFGMEWGNIPKMIGLIFLNILAGTAFGIVCIYLVKNMAVSVVMLFTFVWIFGFLGGSFETYMFSATPEKIKLLSPIYYVTRSLVEYSIMGHTEYAIKGSLVLIGITVVCMFLGSFLMKRRMEVE